MTAICLGGLQGKINCLVNFFEKLGNSLNFEALLFRNDSNTELSKLRFVHWS